MTDEESGLKAEVELLRRRAGLWTSAEALLHAGTWERDLTTNLGYWSDELRRILGLEGAPAQMSPGVFLEALHPDDRAGLTAVYRSALEDGAPRTHRHRIVRPSGEVRWLETSMCLERDAEGRALRLVGVTTDRTGEQRMTAAIQARALDCRAIVAETSDGIFAVDEHSRFIDANRAACELLGYSREELLTLSIADLQGDPATPHFDAVRAGKRVRTDLKLRRKDGSFIPVDLSAKGLSDGRAFAIVRDMTARVASEQAHRQSEQTLQELAANLPALFWVRDAQSGKVLYANAGWARLTGRPPTIGGDFSQLAQAVHPEDLALLKGGSQRALREGFDEIIRFVDPQGASASYRVRAFPIRDGNGKPYRIAGVAENIEEQRAAEEKSRASLREKEILLKEIHHRVKNNLQVVSSLLHLQSTKTGEPRFAELLQESQNRVASMALIHEMLYQADDLSRIPFGTYVGSLASSLGLSWGVLPDRVSVVVEAGDVVLDVGTAVPCGLLLNEILSNCLKHAYPAGRRGTVRVALGLGAGHRYRLEVSDDGVGLPVDFEERRRTSLGTKLIDRLVAQLDGTLARSNSEHGTRYEITFPREPGRPPG